MKPLAALCAALVTLTPLAPAATWTKLTNPTPNGDQAYRMRLLTDGTVMVAVGVGPAWLRLTPDATGSYINGAWSTDITSLNTHRNSYPSEVLQNGKVWIFGGENYGPNDDDVWTATGEIWDPIGNTWSPVANFPPQSCFGITFNVGANSTVGSNIITNISTTVTPTFVVGWTMSGPGIPAGATITSIDSTSQVHISQNATATQSGVIFQFSGTPTSCFGDVPTMLLDGGQILAGSLVSKSTYLYNIASNSWSLAANKVYNDSSDEESWAKLSDGRVLTYDIGQSSASGKSYAEVYNPMTNSWSSISPADGTATGTFPLLSSAAAGYELGPELRLLDGRIFVIGATGHTALYTPSTNSWAAGPDIVGTINGNSILFGADDAPAAAMPNGHVLLAADAGPSPVITTGNVTLGSNIITNIPSTAKLWVGWPVTQTSGVTVVSGGSISSIDSSTQVHISQSATGTTSNVALQFGGPYSAPTQIFDFDPSANTISPVSPAIPDSFLNTSVYETSMLTLPTGQVLFADGSYQLWIYTPDGSAPAAYQPVITNVVYNGGGIFTLTGTQLNGQSAGAGYGDDAEMDENYPIVSLVSSAGSVYYCRTTNWSTTGVGSGSTPESVNLTLNPSLPAGNYSLIVSGAGIASTPVAMTITQAEVNGVSDNPNDSISGQVTFLSSPLANVTIWLNTGQNTTTNSAGNYSFPNLTASTNYTVTPTLLGYRFSPSYQNITGLSGNQITNFSAFAVTGELGFLPVTPCRVVDTRGVNGSLGGPSLTSNSTRTFPLPSGSCGLPTNASAYSMNVTVVPKSALEYLTLWPTGQPQPNVSTLNSFDGRVVANAAIVPAGSAGAINVYVTDATDVVIDVNGYFGPSGTAGALTFVPVTPCRVEDTRNANGPFGGPILAAGSTRTFPFPSSTCSIPSTAAAYSVNATVVPTTTLQYLTLFPSGVAQPYVSTLNSYNGQVVANAAIVPAGSAGALSAYVTDQTNLITDINGYFTSTPATPLVFNAMTPCRVVDTRNPTGTFGGPIMAADSTRTFPIPVSSCGLPSNAAAYAFNVTVVPNGGLNYLTLWPAGQTQPFVSTLNSYNGQVVANAALVPSGSAGSVSVYVTDQTHVILDIVGYFTAP